MFGGFSSKNGPASFSFPSPSLRPVTMKDWKITLVEVKRLYLLKQYKQCAAHCMKLLANAKEPLESVHRAFLTFYAAICYELLGRAVHIHSAKKVTLLRLALENFVNCAAALPPLVNLPRLPKGENDIPCPPTPVSVEEFLATFEPIEGVPCERDSMMSSITRMIDASISRLDDPFLDTFDETDDGYVSSFSSPSRSPRSFEAMFNTEVLKPRPLLIRKASVEKVPVEKHPEKHTRLSIPCDENSGQSKRSSKRNSRFRPPRLPLKVIPSSQLNARMSSLPSPKSELFSPGTATTATFSPITPIAHAHYPTSPSTQPSAKVTTFPIENLTPTHAAQIVRSNRGIAFLREQVGNSIFEIRQQIRKVKQIQDLRRKRDFKQASPFWSFDPVVPETGDNETYHEPGPIVDEIGNMRVKESMNERIMRLRAEGWDTVGLRSPRSTWKGSRYYQELCAMVLTEQHLDSCEMEMD
ncbi:hypothetical protein N7451_002156 [Penicillium sp. IBT 35674x]|nr:hypothetical protein N7451_002156 [Penicillium sp. IBT 35674x]